MTCLDRRSESDFKRRIFQYVDERADEMLRLVQNLVRVPSISGTAHEGKAQQLIIEELSRIHGIDLDVYEPDLGQVEQYPLHPIRTTAWTYKDRPNVVGVLRGIGGGRSLILNGHIDVVSPEPIDNWTRDPWSGDVEGNRLYGRGSLDQKAGLVSALYAVKCVRDLGLKLKGDIVFESVTEEELGGGGCIATVVKGYKADAAIVTDCFSGKGAILIGQGGSRFFRIRIRGRTQIASKQEEAPDAVRVAMKIYDALIMLQKRRASRLSGTNPEYERLVKEFSGSDKITTLTIGILRAGDWPSHVAGWAEMEGRIGFPPNESGNQVEREIEETITTLSLDDPWMKYAAPVLKWVGARREGYLLDADEPIVQTVKDCIEVVTFAKAAVCATTVNSDASWLTPRVAGYGGIPTILYAPGGANAHSADEYVLIEDIIAVTKVLALTLCKWCRAG